MYIKDVTGYLRLLRHLLLYAEGSYKKGSRQEATYDRLNRIKYRSVYLLRDFPDCVRIIRSITIEVDYDCGGLQFHYLERYGDYITYKWHTQYSVKSDQDHYLIMISIYQMR